MNDRSNAYSKIVTKAWSDPDFKARLLSDPKAALAEAGVQVPDGVRIDVLEDTEDVVHMVLPASPAGDALSADELEQVAGGTFTINIAVCVYTYVAGCKTVGEDCAP